MAENFVKVLLEIIRAAFFDNVEEGLAVVVVYQPVVKYSENQL